MADNRRVNEPDVIRPNRYGKRPTSFWPTTAMIISVFIAMDVATQYFAYLLRFNVMLGKNFHHIYAPWMSVRWYFVFEQPLQRMLGKPYFTYQGMDKAFSQTGWVATGIFIVAMGILMLIGTFFAPKEGDGEDLYDSGWRWANPKIAREDGLLGAEAGPLIGTFQVGAREVPLRYDQELGISIVAPPGKGKSLLLTACLLIRLQHLKAHRWSEEQRRIHPWGEEPLVIVNDPKLELFTTTSGFQKALGKRVVLFAPLGAPNLDIPEDQLDCYNPLWEIRLGSPDSYQDAAFKMLSLIDREGKGLDSHWDRAAHAFGTAIVEKLGFMAISAGDPEINSFPGFERYTSSFQHPSEMLQDMLDREDDPHGLFGWTEDDPDGEPGSKRKTKVKPSISAAVREMMKKEPKELASVLSTMTAFTSFLRSERLEHYITRSTFAWTDLANDRKRASTVYIGMDPMNIPKMRPFLRLVTGAILENLTSGGTGSVNGRSTRNNFRPTWIPFDEVASFKKLSEMEESAGYLRGYGVMLMLVWQSVAQRFKLYGEKDTIEETMGVQIFGAPKTVDGAKYIEALLGQRTQVINKRSTSGKMGLFNTDSVQDSVEHVKLPVLSVKEIMQIKNGKMIMIFNGHNYLVNSPKWYKNKTLKKRGQIPYPKMADGDGVTEPIFLASIVKELGDKHAAWPELQKCRDRARFIASHRGEANSLQSITEQFNELMKKSRVRVSVNQKQDDTEKTTDSLSYRDSELIKSFGEIPPSPDSRHHDTVRSQEHVAIPRPISSPRPRIYQVTASSLSEAIEKARQLDLLKRQASSSSGVRK